MTVAGKVTFGAARHCAQLNVLFNPRQFWDRVIVNARLHTCALTHFAQMAQQTKTRNVGHRFYAFDVGKGRACDVHPAHHFRR
ncbi:Uncharacterised protein [Shigella sonnei]|nr:Uncharacterised protein [Shigella sonnei]CSF67213.1 Uncharacterised protein [Shigella sonnei]CSF84995.1 Uncharacterised protein [Shigella sonnei]CSG59405.1 Uncharacterised protein [Shigella sonnei]